MFRPSVVCHRFSLDGSRIENNEELTWISFSRIAANCFKLLPELQKIRDPVRLVALGRADVNVEVIEWHPRRLLHRMRHYLKRLHGTAFPNPDMTVEVCLLAETIRALNYRDCFGSLEVLLPGNDGFQPVGQG